jgi:hypothetical protein
VRFAKNRISNYATARKPRSTPRRDESDGTVITFPVPVHAGKTLKPGTLKGIFRIAGLEVENLLDFL